MFGGNNDSSNPSFSAFLDRDQLQYGGNVPGLQLFGTFLPQIDANTVCYAGNDQISLLDQPNKRTRKMDENAMQKMLQISLNNFPYNESDRPARIPDPNSVSTGLRLYYDDDDHNSSVTCASPAMMPMGTSFGNEVKNEIDLQTEELEYYIKVQGEQLTKGIKELNLRHTASLLRSLEEDACRKLREKDIEIDDINRKNNELVERIKYLATEAQSWQHRAFYNESMVNALREDLNKAMAETADKGKQVCEESNVEDAASSCNPHMILPDFSRNKTNTLGHHMLCKVCNNKEACMLFLDCRHLSLCDDCERFIDVCPNCHTCKTSVIRVYMS